MPDMVSVTTSGNSVSWDTHLIYFPVAIRSKIILFYIIEPKAGFIRLDRNDEEAEVSIYVDGKYRGRGLALTAINDAVGEAFNRWPIKKVVANVREENERSLRAFRRCGFFEDGLSPKGLIRMVSV